MTEVIEKESGYQFVNRLMERQDAVLKELDQLNARIELMIKELTNQRVEDAAQLATLNAVD